MPVLVKARKQDAEPLPTPWFDGLLRRGILTEIGAAPNVGKSFVALRWASHLAERGFPILYVGMDISLREQGDRLFTMSHQRKPYDEDELERWLHDAEIPIRWCDLSLSTGALSELVQAEAIYFGQTPALVIVDVLGELVPGELTVEGVSAVVKDLKVIAREQHSCVLALHHLRDGFANTGNSPVELRDFQYEKGKYAEVMFGLWRGSQGELAMRVLKNRSGAVGSEAHLTFDPSRGYVEYSHA